MNAVESLLNAANRTFEESGLYFRQGSDAGVPVRVSMESRDAVRYTDTADQAFRTVVFSINDGAIGKDETGNFKPRRGDRLTVRGVTYKVVEVEGIAWQPRFDPFDGRIIFFAERTGRNADQN